MDFLDARRFEAGPAQHREAMLVLVLGRTTHHVAAAEVRPVVGEGRERRDDIVDIGDVLLPLDLLALAEGQVTQIELVHDWVIG